MENIENKILQFGELSPDEQEAVEAYVEAHPTWQPLLDDVRTLEKLRTEMRLLHDAGDEALAYYVVARHFSIGVSAPLQHVFDQIDARLARDDALRQRYERLTQRLVDIAAALDPVAQFEKLSGFRLPTDDEGAIEPIDPRADRAPASRTAQGQRARFLAWPRAARWAVAAVLFVAVLYGGLFAFSHLTRSEVDRLALVDLSETEVEGYEFTMRSAPASSDSLSTNALYLRALYTLSDAQTTTLGLFPRYNQEKLGQAERLLQHVVEREEARSFLQLEAHFFLGKVHLAQGEIEAARSNFQTVAVCEGRRTPEAVQILTELQEEYPAHGESYMMG